MTIEFNHDQFTFLRTMGHELRTPLNSIVATCEMLVTGVYGELQPKQDRAAQRVLRNSNRLLRLITQVMLYIRAQANALELASRPIALSALLEESLAKHQKQAEEKGLSLTQEIASDMPTAITGDPDQIIFIVDELLANAIAYTQTGSVNVLAKAVAPDQWQLSVKDTGIGINADEIAQVTKPFIRGKEASQHLQEGNGMGLSIVKEFVRLMGGVMQIESEAGKGCTVVLTLPCQIPAQNAEAMPTPAVLVADPPSSMSQKS